MSKVAVIGAGYVGLTTAACLADLGNEVTVVDIDQARVAQLKKHQVPFYEPGIRELVERNARAGRLHFTTSYVDAVPGAEFAIIAVSTPEGEGGEADLSYVEAAASSIADAMDGPLIVVNKSTVPPLTGDMVSRVLKNRNSKHEAAVVSNPEFLREGSAIQDFMHPDRVVVGSNHREAAQKVASLYAPLQAPVLITPNIYTAEMVKYASNAFLATRISFINEIAWISERVGADAKLVAEGMGLDKRIGAHYLDAGIGWGGSCFPKDVAALAAVSERYNYHPQLLHAVMEINRDQRMVVIDLLRELLDELPGRVIGLLGLAFKPNTDDMREAPARVMIAELLRRGATVHAYDPVAMTEAKHLYANEKGVSFAPGAHEALEGADALVIMTEWKQFRSPDFSALKRALKSPVIFDGRNLYEPSVVKGHGLEYYPIGRLAPK
ncbi:MAG TPA: UDP-glucose/GDP-mannose dehydrogenase family protein [Candidatus Dormibacteraeota bacterium]|nr:UDP-glucose/GDP-mannose dehydrogenase family protein [Candidatus Dormibacteraeota bacterium]